MTEPEYEIVGLTREQAIACGELLASGAIMLDRGRAWLTDTLQIRPRSADQLGERQ